MLSLFTGLINKLQGQMSAEVPRVFEAVFKCTLDMITKNFEDYPDHRSLLFNLLRAMNQHCFAALLQQQSNFTLIIESIKWAFKHTERNVAETGLGTLLELLTNLQKCDVGMVNAFYQSYYLGLLQVAPGAAPPLPPRSFGAHPPLGCCRFVPLPCSGRLLGAHRLTAQARLQAAGHDPRPPVPRRRKQRYHSATLAAGACHALPPPRCRCIVPRGGDAASTVARTPQFRGATRVVLSTANTSLAVLPAPPVQDGTVQASSNGEYLRNLLLQMFSSSFPNLTQPQLTQIIQLMFEHCKDHAAFKQHLRDFLVQLKEFGDSTDLYADELKAQADTKAKDLRARQEAIPGLLNPHARNDDMMGD